MKEKSPVINPENREQLPEKSLRIGVITAPQGIHGEVKVYPTTDQPERFRQLRECFLVKKGRREGIRKVAEGCHFVRNLVILKFQGLDNRDEAELLRETEIYVTRENAEQLSDHEYFVGDLIGLTACTEEGRTFGTILSYTENSGNVILEIKDDQTGDEHLIPAIPVFLRYADLEAGKVFFHLIRGM